MTLAHDKIILIKKALLDHCHQHLMDTLLQLERGITQAREAANLEEKSSAGDKFETTRAMMHLEMESFIRRRADTLSSLSKVDQIKPIHQDIVEQGAIVETDQGTYFIGISAPSIEIDHKLIRCLSTDAPLYKAMQGKMTEDDIEWVTPDGTDILIEIYQVY